MSTPQALYALDPEAFDRIWGTRQREAVAQLVAVEPRAWSREALAQNPEALAGVEVLLSGWGAPLMDQDFLERAPELKVVLYAAGAVRGFATPALFARGVKVSSANAGNAIPVAEYAVAAIHLSLKRAWRFFTVAGDPDISPAQRHDIPGAYGSTVGLVSLGTIGRLVRERLRPSAVRVVAYDPYVSAAEAEALDVALVSLPDLFAESDVVSLHTPLHAGTAGLVDSGLLSRMKHNATLINTARGGIVRQDELVDVLRARRDLQAVLDVTSPEPLPANAPLRMLPNVVITPHIAGSLGPECHRLADMMVEELARYVAGEELQWQVDPRLIDRLATP